MARGCQPLEACLPLLARRSPRPGPVRSLFSGLQWHRHSQLGSLMAYPLLLGGFRCPELLQSFLPTHPLSSSTSHEACLWAAGPPVLGRKVICASPVFPGPGIPGMGVATTCCLLGCGSAEERLPGLWDRRGQEGCWCVGTGRSPVEMV